MSQGFADRQTRQLDIVATHAAWIMNSSGNYNSPITAEKLLGRKVFGSEDAGPSAKPMTWEERREEWHKLKAEFAA